VFLLELTQRDSVKGGQRSGKLYLVDLAGSEKVRDIRIFVHFSFLSN
jgi:hypothetical protein